MFRTQKLKLEINRILSMISFLLMFSAIPAIAGQQTTATSTTTLTDTATGTSVGASSQMGPSKIGFGTPSIQSAADARSAEKPSEYSYVTNEETERLQKAIDAYNSDYPDTKITEIDTEAITKLMLKGYLREKPETLENILLNADGKVVKKVKNAPVQGEGKGASSGSLNSLVTSASKHLDTSHAKIGAKNTSGSSVVKLEKRTVTVRTATGETKEVTETVPQLVSPATPVKPAGRAKPTSPSAIETMLKVKTSMPAPSQPTSSNLK
ncbi:MAG: hypothetical protein HQM10_21770 [Candidatus Riflebacteria bacterium]|nr:hypothetical protein [Candidatus Riflebacteria bacterium]